MLYLFGERRISRRARRLELADLAVDFVERFFQRLNQLANRFLARVEVSLRGVLKSPKRFFCKIEEASGVSAERISRECLECIAKLALRISKQPKLLGCRFTFSFELGFK